MLNKVIRKISIGSDVNNQLHISVGSVIGGKQVDTIRQTNPNAYEVWIQQNHHGDIGVWKSIENMPVLVEYNTRLD